MSIRLKENENEEIKRNRIGKKANKLKAFLKFYAQVVEIPKNKRINGY